MYKASMTIFKYYMALMDSFSESLLHMYPEGSLDNPDHYKVLIINKIARMFHSLETLVENIRDEVSARCVLRGILDSVTIYCFIYERTDNEEVLFRHLLYIKDGFKSYRDKVGNIIVDKSRNRDKEESFEELCDQILSQVDKKLFSHPYSSINKTSVETIIKNGCWNYVSLFNKPKSVKFGPMYRHVGFEEKTAEYYQSVLSQYAHGLCLSNLLQSDMSHMKKILFESLPFAYRMVEAILHTFPDRRHDLLNCFHKSTSYQALSNNPEFKIEEFLKYFQAVRNHDTRVIID